MPKPLRMGAEVGVADDQRSSFSSASVVVTRDEQGRELEQRLVADEPPLVLQVVHFVDLADGRRVTTEDLGEMTMSVPRDWSVDELRAEVREFIFEEEMREAAAEEMADDPLWGDMLGVLREEGATADEATLRTLPFVVELDDAVLRVLSD